jgi:hypothetical protein
MVGEVKSDEETFWLKRSSAWDRKRESDSGDLKEGADRRSQGEPTPPMASDNLAAGLRWAGEGG